MPEQVGWPLHRDRLRGLTVQIKVRFTDFGGLPSDMSHKQNARQSGIRTYGEKAASPSF